MTGVLCAQQFENKAIVLSKTTNEYFKYLLDPWLRANATPRHVPARIVQVSDIPRTISGKIVELAVKNVVHNRPVKNTDALDLYKNLPELQS